MPIKRIRKFIKKNERYLSPAALLVGFVFDNLTLNRIDQLYGNMVLFSYLVIVGIGISVLQLHRNDVLKKTFINKISLWLPFFIQFAFGGLFSGYFIFYLRSASLPSSWLFILVLLGLLIGNEFFRKHYTRFTFQISIYYLDIFSFVIFFVPVIIGKIGAWVFVLSGIISLLVIWAVLYFFTKIIPEVVASNARALTVSVLGIYIAMNILYFQNIIPPIPLSLKDIEVFNFIEKTKTGDYTVVSEDKQNWSLYGLINKKINVKPGDPIYVFSSVFAPNNIHTDVVYVWEYYNENTKLWVVASEIQVSVVGGRDGGYRSFSFKKNIFPGKWRVGLVTKRGQLIGRTTFIVNRSEGPYPFKTEIR